MYYVTYSEYYPIYEPAEGGYYYSGKAVCLVETAITFKKARLKMRKWFKSYCDSNWISKDKLSFGYSGEYVGEGWICEVSREPVKPRGYISYC